MPDGRMPDGVVLAAIVGVILVAAAPALAEPRRPVSLQIDGCADAVEIRRIVALELDESLAVAPSAAKTQALVTCSGGRAVLQVRETAIALSSHQRTLDLTDPAILPKARARLVALAMVELISTTWTEPDFDDSGERTGAAAPDSNGIAARYEHPAATTWRVLAVGGGMAFTTGTGLLAGGAARLGIDRGMLGAMLELGAHHGSRAVSLGTVTTDVLDATAAVGLHRAWSRVRLEVAAGMRGGAVRLGGSTTMMSVRADHFWAPWLGALALGDVELAISARFALALGVEGGRVITPVGGLVGDRREVAVDGGWFGVHVGIGMFL